MKVYYCTGRFMEVYYLDRMVYWSRLPHHYIALYPRMLTHRSQGHKLLRRPWFQGYLLRGRLLLRWQESKSLQHHTYWLQCVTGEEWKIYLLIKIKISNIFNLRMYYTIRVWMSRIRTDQLWQALHDVMLIISELFFSFEFFFCQAIMTAVSVKEKDTLWVESAINLWSSLLSPFYRYRNQILKVSAVLRSVWKRHKEHHNITISLTEKAKNIIAVMESPLR